VIADDLSLFREGLKLYLKQFPQLELCGEATTGEELVELVAVTVPDIVIADIEMPLMKGIEATKIISSNYPAVKVIALTMYGEQDQIVDMLDAGAKGYLQKDVLKDDLIVAIETVMDGHVYYCNSTSKQLAKIVGKRPVQPANFYPPEWFSEKEIAIIQLICEEKASKEIADAISLTVSTVETYRKRIFEKIGCKNIAGVVVYAVRTGIFRVGS
jgi:two-component system response regulator NreC